MARNKIRGNEKYERVSKLLKMNLKNSVRIEVFNLSFYRAIMNYMIAKAIK